MFQCYGNPLVTQQHYILDFLVVQQIWGGVMSLMITYTRTKHTSFTIEDVAYCSKSKLELEYQVKEGRIDINSHECRMEIVPILDSSSQHWCRKHL